MLFNFSVFQGCCSETCVCSQEMAGQEQHHVPGGLSCAPYRAVSQCLEHLPVLNSTSSCPLHPVSAPQVGSGQSRGIPPWRMWKGQFPVAVWNVLGDKGLVATSKITILNFKELAPLGSATSYVNTVFTQRGPVSKAPFQDQGLSCLRP